VKEKYYTMADKPWLKPTSEQTVGTFVDAMKSPRHPNAFVKIQMHFHIGIISEGANLYSFLMAQQQTRIYRE